MGTKINVGVLVLVLLTASFYIMLPGKVRFDFTNTYTRLSVYENDKLVIGATEYVNLYQGTKKITAVNRTITQSISGTEITVKRVITYPDSQIIQEYVYDGSTENVELTPVKSIITCLNCQKKILQVEYKDLLYTGITRDAVSPESFGHKIKIEWQSGAYYQKITQGLTDKLVLKYKPINPVEMYEIRMFDPTTLGLNMSGFTTNITAELGSLISVNATTDGGTVCIDINHHDYGTNYSCGTSNSTAFTLNISNFQRDTFYNTTSNSTLVTSQNISFTGLQNKTIYIPSHQWDEIDSVTLDVRNYNTSNMRIFINGSLSNTLPGGTGIINTFNDSSSTKSVLWDASETQIAGYVHVPKDAVITSAYLTVTGQAGYDYVQITNADVNDSTQGDGRFSPYYPETNIYDGNWGTYAIDYSAGYNEKTAILARTYNTNSSMDISKSKVEWKKNGATPEPRTNTTVPVLCSDYSATVNKLVIFDGSYYGDNKYSWVKCQISGSAGTYISANSTYVAPASYSGTSQAFGYFYEQTLWIYMNGRHYPQNLSAEIGSLNGTKIWNYSAELNTSSTSASFSTRLTDELAGCVEDSTGYCDLPVYIYNQDLGTAVLNITINYVNDIYYNDTVLDQSLFNAYVTNSSDAVSVPITIESSATAVIYINDFKYTYSGGNKTYTLLAHDTAYTTNLSRTITYYHSRWDYTMPPDVEWLEFIPTKPTAKNVTPYGQRTSQPIMNVTFNNYGGKTMNYSMYINDSSPSNCVDLYTSLTSTKPTSYLYDQICYQESANVSTSCGGLSTGTYSATTATLWDGNWLSYTELSGYHLVNYTIPAGVSSAYWQVKNPGGIYNLTLSSVYLSNNTLQCRVYLELAGENTYWQCLNTTGSWVSLRTYLVMDLAYEEGVFWNISSAKLFNNFWNNLTNNQAYESNTGLWMWADFNCTNTQWQLWNPGFSFRGCCTSCDICSELTE